MEPTPARTPTTLPAASSAGSVSMTKLPTWISSSLTKLPAVRSSRSHPARDSADAVPAPSATPPPSTAAARRTDAPRRAKAPNMNIPLFDEFDDGASIHIGMPPGADTVAPGNPRHTRIESRHTRRSSVIQKQFDPLTTTGSAWDRVDDRQARGRCSRHHRRRGPRQAPTRTAVQFGAATLFLVFGVMLLLEGLFPGSPAGRIARRGHTVAALAGVVQGRTRARAVLPVEETRRLPDR
jgi:hypothetical protein